MLGENPLDINKNIVLRFKLDAQQSKIWLSLQQFFFVRDNWNKLLLFLKNDSKFSLRVIDYFLTNYSSNNNIVYKKINIFNSYKQQLKKFHKKFFDPCSRGLRIPFFISNEECILTTICQLNFFKWFIQTNIYEYLISNYSEIKKSMKNKSTNNNNNNNLNYSNDKVIYCSTGKNLQAIFD